MTRGPGRPAAKYRHVFTIWAASLGIAAVGLMLIFSIRDYLPFPILDEWNIIATLDQNHGHFPLGQLWAQHNEHRIPFARLLFLADLFWFHGNNLLPFLVIYLMQGVQLFLIVWAIHRWADWPRWMTVTAAGLAAFALFWPSQWESFLNPFEVSYIAAFFGCTTAIILVLAACQNVKPNRWLAAAIGAALLAEANLANGLMVWPFLIAMAARLRLGRRRVAVLALASVAFLAVYLYGYTRPAYHADPTESLKRPLLVVRYLMLYLATGWAGRGQICGLSLAAIALFTTPACYLWELFRSRTSPFRLAIASLSLLLLCTGLLTALGRINFPLAQASASRYQTPALLFWLFFAIYWMVAASRYRALYAVIVCAGTLFSATAMLASFTVARNDADRMSHSVHRAVLPVQAGVNDAVVSESIHPDPNIVFTYTQFLKDHSDGFFRDPSYRLLGGAISQFALRPPSRCFGKIESVRKIPDAKYPGWEIRGWARDSNQPNALEKLIAVADSSTITGIGAADPPGQWRLYLRGAQDGPAIEIYGIVDSGKGLCLVSSDRLATIER